MNTQPSSLRVTASLGSNLLEACVAARRALADLNGRVSREVWINLFETNEMLDSAIQEAESYGYRPQSIRPQG